MNEKKRVIQHHNKWANTYYDSLTVRTYGKPLDNSYRGGSNSLE